MPSGGGAAHERAEVGEACRGRGAPRRGRPPRRRSPTASRDRAARGRACCCGPCGFVTPIGWMGGRYTTSKPIAATPARRFAAVRNVPLFQLPSFRRRAPSERGKNSYHAPTPARRRSTRISCSGESVVSSASGHAAKTSSAGASTSARRSASDAAVSRSPAASALRRRRVGDRARLLGDRAIHEARADLEHELRVDARVDLQRGVVPPRGDLVVESGDVPVPDALLVEQRLAPPTGRCRAPAATSARGAPAPDGLVRTSIAPTWS